MRATTMLVAAAVLSAAAACGGNDATGPGGGNGGSSANVEVNGLTASQRVWNTGYRVTAEFNLIERGGTAVVLESATLDLGAGLRCEWEPAELFGTNRLPASQNRYGRMVCDTRAAVPTVTVRVPWNADGGGRGTATAQATVR